MDLFSRFSFRIFSLIENHYLPNSFLLAGTMHQPEITGLSWRWRWHPLKTWKPDPCLVCFHRGVWAPSFLLCRTYRRLHPGCSDWSQAAGLKLLFILCSLSFYLLAGAKREDFENRGEVHQRTVDLHWHCSEGGFSYWLFIPWLTLLSFSPKMSMASVGAGNDGALRRRLAPPPLLRKHDFSMPVS